ncbi:hypothetical protein Tco_0750159 [Tanacetum coccineum]|uniref:Uncharacterized protein n=1 Tax=Tanacetum coccineum TaxID=301880 RepID=A0ABQ4Z450_9ASTR
MESKGTTIKESKDLTSLSLDELISNLKVHEVIMKKDSKIVKGKRERSRSLALKAKKKSSDEESLTSGSEYEEYAMAVMDFNKCKDINHLIEECPKPQRNKNQRAFVGGSWSDIGEEEEEKTKDKMCLIAQASNEVLSKTEVYSGDLSSTYDLELDSDYHRLCKISLKVINKNKSLKTIRNRQVKEILELKEKVSRLEKNKEINIGCTTFQNLVVENEKLKEEVSKLTQFEKSVHSLNKMLSFKKPSSNKSGLGFNSVEASSSIPHINLGPPDSQSVKGKPDSFFKLNSSPKPRHIIINNVKVLVASDDEVKHFYKPSLKSEVGFIC